MGKFKNFVNNNQGLAYLGKRISDFINNRQLDDNLGGIFLSSDFSGTETSPTPAYPGHSLFLPSTDMVIPKVNRTGKITELKLNKNPIYIRLSDGTEAYLSYDEFRRIKGKPAIGKTMTIVFQRHPNDNSFFKSKIEQIILHEQD